MASRGKAPPEALALKLGYRPLFEWAGIMRFFSKRVLKGVERVEEDGYSRSVQLVDLSGVGKRTTHYIAMRALRWPDAFPGEDVALRNSLGGVSAARAEELSQAWRPWRSYGMLHPWQNPVLKKENSK